MYILLLHIASRGICERIWICGINNICGIKHVCAIELFVSCSAILSHVALISHRASVDLEKQGSRAGATTLSRAWRLHGSIVSHENMRGASTVSIFFC